MIRVKIRLESQKAEARVLRFDEDTPFETLLEMIANKLRVVNANGAAKSTHQYKLYLDGEALVEETNEINERDDLVLKVIRAVGGVQKQQQKQQSLPLPKPSAKQEDDEPESNRFVGAKVAKYYFVEDSREMELFFGKVEAYFSSSLSSSSSESNEGIWQLSFDDGEIEYVRFQELQECLELAKHQSDQQGIATIETEPATAIAALGSLSQRQAKSKKKKRKVKRDDDDDDESFVTEPASTARSNKKRNKPKRKYKKRKKKTNSAGSAEIDQESFREDVEGRVSRPRQKRREQEEGNQILQRNAAREDQGLQQDYQEEDVKQDFMPNGPPLVVRMKENDVPDGSSSRDGAPSEKDVKTQILSILDTGFHAHSNERHAQQAMKLAWQVMQEYKKSQARQLALLLDHTTSDDNNNDDKNTEATATAVLQGGLVEVTIWTRNSGRPVAFSSWLSKLMKCMCTCFGVKSCYLPASRVTKTSGKCSVTFYGVDAMNCQLAAYAFRVSAERISQLVANFWKQRHKRALAIVNAMDNVLATAILPHENGMKERAKLLQGAAAMKQEGSDVGRNAVGNDEGVDTKEPVAVMSIKSNDVVGHGTNDTDSVVSIETHSMMDNGDNEEERILQLLEKHGETVEKKVLEKHNIVIGPDGKKLVI